MKKLILLICALFFLVNCSSNEDDIQEKVQVSLKFTHSWLASPITSKDLDIFKFETKNGDFLKIERLRYLLSNIKLINDNEIYTFSNYNLIDVGEEKGLTLSLPKKINAGSYQLKFTFGFTDADNIDGRYKDLNAANFNVPSMLGGGYHFMQMDGKFKDNNNQDKNYNYHTIRAVNRANPDNLVFQDTSFEVDLGTITIINNTELKVKMNVAEWFRNPNTWNLNELNTVLMPNFDAQLLMNQNGKSVFSLGEATK